VLLPRAHLSCLQGNRLRIPSSTLDQGWRRAKEGRVCSPESHESGPHAPDRRSFPHAIRCHTRISRGKPSWASTELHQLASHPHPLFCGDTFRKRDPNQRFCPKQRWSGLKCDSWCASSVPIRSLSKTCVSSKRWATSAKAHGPTSGSCVASKVVMLLLLLLPLLFGSTNQTPPGGTSSL